MVRLIFVARVFLHDILFSLSTVSMCLLIVYLGLSGGSDMFGITLMLLVFSI